MSKAEKYLERLFLNNSDFDLLSAEMDVFCPFDAIGMHNQEIRHGYFLRYVLDPSRPHGFGPDCLRAFMWAAAEVIQDDPRGMLKALDVHLMKLDDAIVEREYKSIDLVVKIPTEHIIIAIELKIDASEHSGQLGRYRQIICNDYAASDGWKQLFLFLTKRGDTPSIEDGTGWHALALDNVTEALDRVVAKGVGQPDARMLLGSYVAMLRRRHLNDHRMEELARKLWKEHREALNYLMSRKPDPTASIFQSLSDQHSKIAKELSERLNTQIVAEHSTKAEIRFGFASWDNVPGMMEGTGWKPSKRLLLLIIKRDARTESFRFMIYLGPGPQLRRQALFDALNTHGALINGNWGIQDSWRKLIAKEVPAPSDGETYEGFASKLVDELELFLKSILAHYDAAMHSLPPE